MERNQETKGVLLLGFGGPGGPEEVKPFMAKLMGGRTPGPDLVARVWSRYQAIGGSSPLLEITLAQAAALEKNLEAEKNQANDQWKVYVGMGYWRPWIRDAVARMKKDGIKKGVAISLAPFYSRVSTGAYVRELDLALQEFQSPEIKLCRQWHLNPLYIKALANRVKESLRGISPQVAREIPVVFTAHSLPLNHIGAGDPYVKQARETMTAVSRQLDSQPAYLAFQSKGGSSGPWLEPEVQSVLLDLSREGYRLVVVLPFGFVSDHVETLYDLDIELKQYAQSLGLELVRAPALNDAPEFISALAEIAREDYNLFFAAGGNDE
ncbi:MAG: ferrochelatase [Bacillota bacterium]